MSSGQSTECLTFENLVLHFNASAPWNTNIVIIIITIIIIILFVTET